MYYTVKDSSIWKNSNSYAAYYSQNNRILMGTVREEIYEQLTGQIKYIVEAQDQGALVPVACINGVRFGGIYNYEEYTRKISPKDGKVSSYTTGLMPGDQVVVACINGDTREGVIICSIKHYGRKPVIDFDKDNTTGQFLNRKASVDATKYASEFNGVETLINANGEYRVTFKGQPTNLSKLDNLNDKELERPKYDTDIGSSYYEFDKTGSYTVTDNSKQEPQYIKIDKAGGKLIIVSGKTSLVINKKDQSYAIKNKIMITNSENEWNLNTKKTSIKSTDLTSIESKDIKTKGKLAQKGDVEIMGNSKQTGNSEINGNFKTTGQTLLGGGNFPLVYDIALTFGIGNLGAPVISSSVLLKTVLTKAS